MVDQTTNTPDFSGLNDAMRRFASSAAVTMSEAGERMGHVTRDMQIAKLEGELAEAKRRCAAVVVAAQNALGDRLTLDEREIAAADGHEVMFHRVPNTGEVIAAVYREKPDFKTIDPVSTEAIFDFDQHEDVEEPEPDDPF